MKPIQRQPGLRLHKLGVTFSGFELFCVLQGVVECEHMQQPQVGGLALILSLQMCFPVNDQSPCVLQGMHCAHTHNNINCMGRGRTCSHLVSSSAATPPKVFQSSQIHKVPHF